MKRFILSTFLVLATLASHGKKVYMEARIIEPACESETYENDSLSIRVSPWQELFCYVSIHNKLQSRIYVEWENFRWDGSAVAFDSDSRLFMDQPKRDEAIMSYEESRKNIVQKDLVGESWITPWYHEKDFKHGGKLSSVMIIPIRFSDGKVIDYRIKFEIFNSEL